MRTSEEPALEVAAVAHSQPNKPSWRHDLLVGLVSGAVVAAGTMLGQAALDDQRSSREERLENLRFVRERSSEELINRPFRNMDLQGQNLSGLDLAGADLVSANLKGSDLAVVVLNNANLLTANLEDSHLRYVRLEKADLTFAKMKNANLEEAHLAGADFSIADLRGANLQNADLTGADLGGARLEGANLKEAKLDSAIIPSGSDSPCSDESTEWPDGFAVPDDSQNPSCTRAFPWL